MRGSYEGDDWTNVIIPGSDFDIGKNIQVELYFFRSFTFKKFSIYCFFCKRAFA